MRPLVLTMGEPAGIGGEIALAAWLKRDANLPVFALLDDPGRLAALAGHLGWVVPIREVAAPEDALDVWQEALPVLPLPLERAVTPGRPDPANAVAVIASIEQGVALVRDGAASALVTNPINKHVLLEAGFQHPGHTEFLASLAGTVVVMMLVAPGLRAVPLTIHVGLREALRLIDQDLILTAARIVVAALKRDFGIAQPRLAFAGLNPHAGENGAFGREEIDVIAPALARLRAEGIDAAGPLPADTMFHPAARARYDVALCMYHDQALIPIKTIDFERGVNVTLGLPFIRTSPDHGTAFDIAGTGKASPESLIAALKLAAQMAEARGRA